MFPLEREEKDGDDGECRQADDLVSGIPCRERKETPAVTGLLQLCLR